MKDKRTYKTQKEHSNDMSYENEATITNEGKRTYKVIKNIPEENVVIMEDRGESSLTLLIENYKKEIWEWKQKESQWVRDKNLLEGNKRIVEELSTKMVEIGRVNLDLKKRVQEAQGDISLAKVMNSPEMRKAQDRVKRLDDSLVNALEINESHQRYNGKLQKQVSELQEDNKKLSKQVGDYITNHQDKLRKAGM